MRIVFLIISLSLSQYVLGQNAVSDSSNYCTVIMRLLSNEWKLDSTGNNGFRRRNFKGLLGCGLQKINKEKVIELLGKPNQILETYKTLQYLYYYYDIRTLPKGFDGPLACWGISINFREGSDIILSISEFDTDL